MPYLGVHSAEADSVIAVNRQCWAYTQHKSTEQVPRGTAQASSPMSIYKLKLCERSRTSEVTLSSAVTLCWIPTENSLARQKWAKDDVSQHSSMFMQKSPPLERESQGKDMHFVFEYYCNMLNTAHLKEEKSLRTFEARSCCWASICCCCLAAISCNSASVMSMRGVATWKDYLTSAHDNQSIQSSFIYTVTSNSQMVQ